ncbi:hypothetical protein CR513_10161, partial [Mucuna pruriens]
METSQADSTWRLHKATQSRLGVVNTREGSHPGRIQNHLGPDVADSDSTRPTLGVDSHLSRSVPTSEDRLHSNNSSTGKDPHKHLKEFYGARNLISNIAKVQPPLPSIVQPLQPKIIIANKLQVEQKERLLQDLKKLRDFDEHLVKHFTLRFLLKKPPEDVALKLLRWMRRRRLPQETTNLSEAKILIQNFTHIFHLERRNADSVLDRRNGVGLTRSQTLEKQ